MRRSEFHRAVQNEFGDRGISVVADLVLSGVGYRTAAVAIEEGVPPREVWMALCEETDVTPSRRYGVGRLDPKS